MKVSMRRDRAGLVPSPVSRTPAVARRTKLALVIGNGEDYDVWMFDVMKRTWNRLTFGGLNRKPPVVAGQQAHRVHDPDERRGKRDRRQAVRRQR